MDLFTEIVKLVGALVSLAAGVIGLLSKSSESRAKKKDR